MKVFVVCCVLLGVVQVRSAPLSEEQRQTLETYCQECVKETNVNKILVDKARKGIFSEDPALKSYLFCLSKKLGFQDVDGIFQKEVIQKKVSGLTDNQDAVLKVVTQCTVQKDSPQDTSFYFAKCMQEVAPDIKVFKVAPEVVYLPNEKAQKLFADHKDCAAQDVLDDQVIEQARKQGILFEDPKFKSYIYCFSKKTGMQRADGSIDKEIFYEGFGKIIDDSAVVEKLAQKCLQQQETPEDTAYFVSKCINENSPVYVEIFPREITVPTEESKKIIEQSRACIKETGVDREVVEKTRQGVYSDDPALKEFAFCMAKKAGFLNESGDIQVDQLRETTLKWIKDPVVVQKLIDQCAVKKSSPQETAFHSHVCFHKNSPGHLSLTQFGNLSDAQKEKRNQIIKECAEDSGVSRSVVLSARKGDFQDDPLLQKYFFCINKKSGILNEAGEYKNDVMKKGLSEIFNAEEADRLIEKCARNLETPLTTSFEGIRCFFNEVPEITAIF